MPMNFCPKCKSLIVPRTVNNETLMLCNQCGWYKIMCRKVTLVEKEKIEQEPEKGKGVVKDKNALARFFSKCPKCGYNKAEIQDIGMQYSDEDTLILIKCGKCGHVERLGKVT